MTLTTNDYRLTTIIQDENFTKYTNVWAFKAKDALKSAQLLTEAWVDVVWPPLKAVLSVQGQLTNSICANLDDVLDYYEASYTGAFGTATGDRMPASNGYAFRLNRPHAGVRNGRKTFGPISEAHVVGDTAQPAVLGFLAAITLALEPAIAHPTELSTYTLCIPKTVKVEPLGKDPYYVWDELIECPLMPFVRVSTQVSRKVT